ncbi:hypothetical protein N7523_010584 [Penicillium sp. IBT 18751x]|nr:hypothetical protein N7523_010584 [Penicillium sp. IBT 18751x]
MAVRGVDQGSVIGPWENPGESGEVASGRSVLRHSCFIFPVSPLLNLILVRSIDPGRLAVSFGRIGRRPAAKAFPHGEMQIWSVEPHQRQSDTCDVKASPSVPRSRSISSVPSDTTEELGTPQKIDSPDSDDSMLLGPEKLLAYPTELQTTQDAIRTVLDVDQFTAIHMPFMWGTSFVPESQKTVYAILQLSAPTLTEGYLAFIGLMTSYQRSLIMRRNAPDMKKAALGLQRLRSVKITQIYDAACALFLGQTMYVFNVLTAHDSSTAHSIIRSSLMSTKSWFSTLLQYPVMDTIIMTPILIDTVECLARREIPIIKLPVTERIIIDRYAGLCTSLLPILYDLCVCSHDMKRNVTDLGSDSCPGHSQRLAEIEEKILHWKPRTSPQMFEDFAQHEILAMVTQANVYRLAALLVIHRLRYPLGVQDGAGRDLANSIFAEMSFFTKSETQKTTALPIVFPLTVSMFEIQGPGEALLERLSSFTVQSTSALRLQEFVKRVRASRETGFGGLWFELVETQLHAAMPP